MLSSEITGRTLGILGPGRIATAAARRASGFEMTVLYTGRSEKPDFPGTFVPLDEGGGKVGILLRACAFYKLRVEAHDAARLYLSCVSIVKGLHNPLFASNLGRPVVFAIYG